MMRPVLGGPGVSDERRWSHKYIFTNGQWAKLPGGGLIDTAKSRDPFNGGTPEVLSPGLIMGQIGTGRKWAPSFFARVTAAVAHGATTVNVAPVEAVEIVRREGATGTLLCVGPTMPNGQAQVGRLAYSAVNQTTGDITVTATGQNEVQTVNIAGTISGGTFRLGFIQGDGTVQWTGTIAHNATFSTVITNANTALDALFGTGKVVASGAGYTALAITFTLTDQALRNVQGVQVATQSLTGATGATVTETTPGYFGALAAGTLIGSTDGSFFPHSVIHPGYGVQVADGASNPAIGGVVQWASVPMSGMVEWSELTPVVTDVGIRRWIAQQLNNVAFNGGAAGGGFSFSDFYNM